MALNLINLGFTGKYNSNYADKRSPYSQGDNNDIFYFLGTDYGRSAWVNPQSNGQLTVTASVSPPFGASVLGLTDNQTGSVNNTFYYGGTGGALPHQLTFQFLTCKVKPYTLDFFNNSAGTPHNNRIIEGSNDGNNWTLLASLGNYTSGAVTSWNNIFSAQDYAGGYWRYLRYTYTPSVGNNVSYAIRELKLYGQIKADLPVAGKVDPIYGLAGLSDLVLTTPKNGDILYWDNGMGYNKRETFYKILRQTLTGNYTISGLEPNFFSFDLGGANRSISLPTTGLINGQSYKILNRTPTYNLSILSGATTLTTIGGTTKLADCTWSGTDWRIIRG